MSITLDLPQIEYPESDGQPMAETELHANLMCDLYFAIDRRFLNDPQCYASRNMFLYYVKGKPGKRVAPDVFFVRGVKKHIRRTYKLWEEGVAPQVVFEISSLSTMREDQHKKPKIYGQIGVQEYYLFDPTQEYLEDGPLVALHWCDGRFVEQDVSSNRIYSPALDLDLVVQDGQLRLADPQSGLLLMTPTEEADAREQAEFELDQEIAQRKQDAVKRKRAEAEREQEKTQRVQAEVEREQEKAQRVQAEAEREQEKAQREQAEAEREQEKAQREQAESELIRLRQELAALKR